MSPAIDTKQCTNLRSLLTSSLISDLAGDAISHFDLLGVDSSSSQLLLEGVLISKKKAMNFLRHILLQCILY